MKKADVFKKPKPCLSTSNVSRALIANGTAIKVDEPSAGLTGAAYQTGIATSQKLVTKWSDAQPKRCDLETIRPSHFNLNGLEDDVLRKIMLYPEVELGSVDKRAKNIFRQANVSIKVSSVADLHLAIKKFPNLQSLTIENCQLTDADIACLKKCNSLQRIAFGYQPQLSTLAIAELPANITDLDFSSWPEVPTDILLAAFQRYPMLERLSFAGRPLSQEETKAIPSSLTDLDVSSSLRLPPEIVGFKDLLHRLTQLKRLNLSGRQFTPEQAGELSSSIQELDISRCHFVGNSAAEILRIALQRVVNLISLKTVFDRNFDSEALKKYEPLRALRKLDFSNSLDMNDTVLAASLKLVPNLTTLILDNCESIDGTGLHEAPLSIQIASFRRCLGFTDERLAPALLRLIKLKRVSLAECHNMRGTALSSLQPDVADLNLDFCEGLYARHLQSALLNQLTKLEILVVSRCSDAIDRLLSTSLPDSMQRLVCAGGNLTDEQLKLIFTRCPKLEELDVSKCGLLEGTTFDKLPQSMRRLILEKNSDSPELQRNAEQLQQRMPDLQIRKQ